MPCALPALKEIRPMLKTKLIRVRVDRDRCQGHSSGFPYSMRSAMPRLEEKALLARANCLEAVIERHVFIASPAPTLLPASPVQ